MTSKSKLIVLKHLRHYFQIQIKTNEAQVLAFCIILILEYIAHKKELFFTFS